MQLGLVIQNFSERGERGVDLLLGVCMAAMSPAQQVEAMASWTSEQIDAYVSRNV